jgi:hypothetical protein
MEDERRFTLGQTNVHIGAAELKRINGHFERETKRLNERSEMDNPPLSADTMSAPSVGSPCACQRDPQFPLDHCLTFNLARLYW